MSISNANRVRQFIISLRGAEFTVDDLPEVNNPHSVLYKLEKQGEIEVVGHTKGRDKSPKQTKVYREIGVKLRGAKADMPQDDPMRNWKQVFPEMFAYPKLKGSSRIVTQN